MRCNGEVLDSCRTGLYAQSDIAEFTPSSGDLAYPEKLEMMKEIEKEHTLEKVTVFPDIHMFLPIFFKWKISIERENIKYSG